MPIWAIILILSGGIISVGVAIDLVSKRKNRQLSHESQNIKIKSEQEIHEQQNVSQTINQIIHK